MLKELAKGKTVGNTVSAAFMENGQVKGYTASVNKSGISPVSVHNATAAEKAVLQGNDGQAFNRLDVEGSKGERIGPVEITPPPNATPEQIAQTKAYIEGSNQALQAGKLSSTGRVSTAGSLRIRANTAVAKEKARAAAAGTPYKGHVGHVPDTTWTGSAEPYSWLDFDPSVNMSIGGQANRYPIGYKPTEFRYKERK